MFPRYRYLRLLHLLTAGMLFGGCAPDYPLLAGSHDNPAPDRLSFPLAAAGPHLLDHRGSVVTLIGDTPWSLAAQLDSAEVLHYLDVRARQGFNAIMFNLIEHRYADGAPSNVFGEPPFNAVLPDGEEDLTAFNPSYWDHVEWIVEEASERGLACFLVPAYLGANFNSAGWSQELVANGPAGVVSYGDSLTRRFAPHENVIWVLGGDSGPIVREQDLREEVDALASSLRHAPPGALLTAHSRRQRSALDSYDAPWLDINTTYSDVDDGPERLLDDYVRSKSHPRGPLPSLWIEGDYENGPGISEALVRAQMYWSLLSGARGHFYGAHPVWYFGASAASHFADSERPPYDSWRSALDSDAANDVIHLRWLMQEVPLHDLRPDLEGELVVSPRPKGDSWIASAYATDRSVAVVYTPRRRTLTLDLTFFDGPSVRIRWISPRTGAQWDAGLHPAEGRVRLPPPDRGDWLLTLETEPSTRPGSE
jgi:hypothetical protein